MSASLGPIAEKYRHYDTHDDEVWVKWFRCPRGAVETFAPALGDAMSGETAPFGYICTETHAEPVSDADSHIVVTYKTPKRFDAATDLSEILRIGPRTLTRGRSTGTRVFLAPDATAGGEVSAHLPIYSPWSGPSTATVTGVYSAGSGKTTLTGTGTRFTPACVGASIVIASIGTFTVSDYTSGTSIKVTGNATSSNKTFSITGEPLLVEVEPEPLWRVGLTRIVAHYSTLTGGHTLERNPGVGVLEMDFSTIADKEVYDLDGDPVETEFFTDGVKYRWHVIRGSATIPRVHASLRIRVALSAPSIATLAALVGCVNSDACPKLGNAGIKTLWLRQLRLRQSERYSSIYWGDIRVEWNSNGWHQWCQVEKQQWRVVQQSVLKSDYSASGKMRDVGGWISLDTPQYAYRDVMPYAAFATINGYIA